jgi:hypothetical protein
VCACKYAEEQDISAADGDGAVDESPNAAVDAREKKLADYKDELGDSTVPELRQLCSDNTLPTGGVKAALITRLVEYLAKRLDDHDKSGPKSRRGR